MDLGLLFYKLAAVFKPKSDILDSTNIDDLNWSLSELEIACRDLVIVITLDIQMGRNIKSELVKLQTLALKKADVRDKLDFGNF